MANYKSEESQKKFEKQVLYAAARLFLENGYTRTTLREIASTADVNISSMNQHFGCKENILAALVEYVLEGQFTVTTNLLKGKTENKILFYAAETTLQLHMAESSENVRDMYSAAYSMPKTSGIIQHAITGKLEEIFKEHLSHLETKDFYELEIASGGIMRGFMTIPCDMYFTMERKVKRFLETTFLIYRVSDEMINEAVEFVSQFDFEKIAEHTIDNMLKFLEENN